MTKTLIDYLWGPVTFSFTQLICILTPYHEKAIYLKWGNRPDDTDAISYVNTKCNNDNLSLTNRKYV